MLGLEGWMDIRSLHQQGLSISAIARREGVDRKTVRKYLRDGPHEYQREPRAQKIDAYRSYLRERWEQGVENAYRLFREIRQRGYSGGITRVAQVVQGWRSEGRERAFVRFETAPGQQAQMDWGRFGNWDGKRDETDMAVVPSSFDCATSLPRSNARVDVPDMSSESIRAGGAPVPPAAGRSCGETVCAKTSSSVPLSAVQRRRACTCRSASRGRSWRRGSRASASARPCRPALRAGEPRRRRAASAST